jgi:parallel beta-helix repeat protein
MKKQALMLTLILALSISALAGIMHFGTVQAATNVSGIITSDTTWTKANSPYTLTGPVGVVDNTTLTIEAGVTVNFGEFYLVVNGTLDARGSIVENIHFISNGTSLSSSDAKGVIIFSRVSNSWDEQNKTGSIIENAIISSTQPVPSICIEDTSPKINNCTISSTSYHAISVEGGPIISNSTITNSSAGITITTALSGKNATISDNIISNCELGIYISRGTPIVERNLIINNNGSKTKGEGGIRIDGLMSSSPLIRNNTIVQNSVGINLILSPSPVIIFNNIYGNEYNVYLGSDSSSNVNATYNWWGTTDTQAINQTIHDFYDDFTKGVVTFVPLLTEANPKAPAPEIPPVIPEFSSPLAISTLLAAMLVARLIFKRNVIAKKVKL